MSKEAILKKAKDASGGDRLATEFLEEVRLRNTLGCVHCRRGVVYCMRDRKTEERERSFRWRCRGCRMQSSVRHRILKRGVYGTFHSVSKKHLHRYLAEFEVRYNTREDMDGERLLKALKLSAGKRLTRVACHG